MNNSKILAQVVLSTLLALVVLPLGCDTETDNAVGNAEKEESSTELGPAEQPGESGQVTQADTASAQAESPARFTSSPIAYEPREVDFGIVSPGETKSKMVNLRNVSDRSVTLLRSVTSCGCTSVKDMKGIVIEPNDSYEFEASMKIKSGLGEKHEQVKVLAQGYNPPLVLDLRAVAALPIRVDPPHITAAQKTASGYREIPRGTVKVKSQDREPFRILAVDGGEPSFVNFDPAEDEPQSEYTLRWDVTTYEEGEVPWFWVIETDHKAAPLVDVRIRHASTLPQRGRKSWVLKAQRLLVGKIRVGEPFEVQTWMEYAKGAPPPQTPPTILSNSSNLRAELVDSRVEKQEIHMKIRLTVTSGEPGLFYEKIRINMPRGSSPLRIIGKIVQ